MHLGIPRPTALDPDVLAFRKLERFIFEEVFYVVSHNFSEVVLVGISNQFSR
jgi:hypothetical protein